MLLLSTVFMASALANDIVLKDGRILANATIVSQSPRNVTIKHATGLSSIAKEQLTPELLARYPIDETAAREADQHSKEIREAALLARTAEKERVAQSQAKNEADTAAQKIADEKNAAQQTAKLEAVKSEAKVAAMHYFEQKYSQPSDMTSRVAVTINDAQPIEGWTGQWRLKGQTTIRRYKNHDLELSRLNAIQPPDITTQEKRSRQIQFLDADYLSEFFDFECVYSTDGSTPSFDIKQHT